MKKKMRNILLTVVMLALLLCACGSSGGAYNAAKEDAYYSASSTAAYAPEAAYAPGDYAYEEDEEAYYYEEPNAEPAPAERIRWAEAILDLAKAERGRILAITIVLAPLVEELMFRSGVFGLLRRWNRYLAYGLCMLLFAMYHTWQYALTDPIFWLYLLQYLPAGYILCRSYEKTECIWTAILLPMLNNTISLLALGG